MQLFKVYETPAGRFTALRGVDLQIGGGTLVAVTGKSGSGKSTLLNMIGGIDSPSSGKLLIAGADIATMTQRGLSLWRGRNVGFVFQFFQLLPTLTVAENVMLPMDFAGSVPPRERHARALDLLAMTGIADQAAKLPSALSGGQQQRVAIARALANDPPLILADEPTGNLDAHTGALVFELLGTLARKGKTVIVVTHERNSPVSIDRTIELTDGHIIQ